MMVADYGLLRCRTAKMLMRVINFQKPNNRQMTLAIVRRSYLIFNKKIIIIWKQSNF